MLRLLWTSSFILFAIPVYAGIGNVVKHKGNGYWGVHMKNGDKPGLTEYYLTHSESWAEDCAENFVVGIKKI